MRYKTAKTVLVEIVEDEQAPTGVRLAAAEMLVEVDKLPELKGYKSGSPENLFLRLASDSKTPAKDRFKAVCQLVDKKNQQKAREVGPRSGASVTDSHQSVQRCDETGEPSCPDN
jgi:uncharacterized protein (UPF0147 family)